jgi:DNA-binding transcriptional LysR family regulator
MNLQHVISFYFLAKERSFSAASEKLFITQPAVTQQIRALEFQFGVKLVNVKKKRVYLTKAGQRFFAYAEELFNHATMTENFLKSYRLNNLHVGISTTMLVWLMGIIDRFKELYPSVQVSVREGPSLVLVEELLDFKHDICVVGTLTKPDKKLRMIRFPKMELMVFVASSDYPLAKGCAVKWEELTHHPLILQSEGSLSREIVLQHFRSRRLAPLIGAEVDNIECVKRLAHQKKGIALMFLPNIADEIAEGTLTAIPVEDCEIQLGIDVVMNKETALSPVAEAFLKILKENLSQILPNK